MCGVVGLIINLFPASFIKVRAQGPDYNVAWQPIQSFPWCIKGPRKLLHFSQVTRPRRDAARLSSDKTRSSFGESVLDSLE